jgi:hypothetical protein
MAMRSAAAGPLGLWATFALAACSSPGGTSAPPPPDASPDGGVLPVVLEDAGAPDGAAPWDGSTEAQPPGDPLQAIFDSVDKTQLLARLDELTGANPVTVNGNTFRITDRWSPAAKTNFRAYWTQYFTGLGATVNEQTFPVPNLVGETEGHNVEAVLPGQSADTVVIIVPCHSDSITGKETMNSTSEETTPGPG